MINIVLNEMIFYFNNDVRRINHALKVYSFAHLIAQTEQLSTDKQLIVDLTAILHDIGIKEAERKYNSTSGKYQEDEGPPIAKCILEKYYSDEIIVDRTCYIIGNHHSYNKINDKDFQIIVEADFLVNIFEDSMDRPTILIIKEKHFKTLSGTKLLESMYSV